MMAASAPYMEKCVSCNNVIEDYQDSKSFQWTENFLDVNECRLFLSKYKYKRNVDTVFNECMLCLRLRWGEIQHLREKKQTQEKKLKKNWEKYLKKIVFSISFIILSILIGCYFGGSKGGSLNTKQYVKSTSVDLNEDKLKVTVTKLRDHFPSLRKGLLKKINGAFIRLKTPGEPFVLLLLHDDTNKKTTDCLASYTSILAKQNIFTNTMKSLWMNASEWAPYTDNDNQDLLYEKLIAPLKENEVLVLENLQDLPWSLAKSFHHLCDSENPQIAKAMYLLEMKVDGDGLGHLTDGDKMVEAERAMAEAWSDAPDTFREALIARLTSYVDVVLLKSDEECSKDSPFEFESFIRISP